MTYTNSHIYTTHINSETHIPHTYPPLPRYVPLCTNHDYQPHPLHPPLSQVAMI